MEEILNRNVDYLTVKGKEIILVGTAHVSKESVELVSSVIDKERPNTVCVELCDSRYQSIRNKKKWLETDIIKVIKEKKAFLLLSNLLLASFQRRIANKLDVQPGQEMIQAIEAGENIGAQIIPADRDIRVTLSRTWRNMSWWDKIKIMFQLLFSLFELDEISEEDVEQMKQEDMLELILADVSKSLPVVKDILIDERDRYLAGKISQAPGDKIVAIVGAGHVPGIRKYLDHETDFKALEEIPPKGPASKLIKWILPILVLGLLVAGFFYGGQKAGVDMIRWWFLANGVLAGIGAIIAFAHPITILSAVLAAPLTSLNPMIAAGWVSGLVEAFTRRPKVVDFENLMNDILSVRGFWRNKITRILLVVVFTNLGSMIGTLVAIPLMMKAFG